MIMLQPPAFPKGRYFFVMGEETPAQSRIGLAWQRVAGLFYSGHSRGTGPEAEACHSSKIIELLYLTLF